MFLCKDKHVCQFLCFTTNQVSCSNFWRLRRNVENLIKIKHILKVNWVQYHLSIHYSKSIFSNIFSFLNRSYSWCWLKCWIWCCHLCCRVWCHLTFCQIIVDDDCWWRWLCWQVQHAFSVVGLIDWNQPFFVFLPLLYSTWVHACISPAWSCMFSFL